LDVAEGAVPARRARPWEDLVPGGVPGPDTVHDDDGLGIVPRGETAIGMGEDKLAERLVECERPADRRVGRLAELTSPGAQPLRRSAPAPPARPAASSIRSAPIRRSTERSCPASSRFARSARQVAKRPIHPSMVYRYRPGSWTRNSPRQRSLPRGRMATFLH